MNDITSTVQQPHQYKRRIMLAVSGMSPQVITETLYSLATDKEQAFIPTEIHLLTTLAGAKEAKLLLLHAKTGKFHALCQDYQIENIEFPEDNIHVIADTDGKLLEDIKTPAQNEAAADFISQKVNEFTQDDTAALHVSIAGGRKTMGYYLGYALSIFGRKQDRLSHVLVTDKYESLRAFFYPTPYSQVIQDHDGRSLDSQDAKVMMAEIPFVRLRMGLPKELLKGNISFSESVKIAQRDKQKPFLEIPKNQLILANGIEIKLKHVDYVAYRWFLECSLEGNPISRNDRNSSNVAEFKDFYRSLYNISHEQMMLDGKIIRTLNTLEEQHGMTTGWLSDRTGNIKKAFENALGESVAKDYLVQSTGRNGHLFHHIFLTDEQIKFD